MGDVIDIRTGERVSSGETTPGGTTDVNVERLREFAVFVDLVHGLHLGSSAPKNFEDRVVRPTYAVLKLLREGRWDAEVLNRLRVLSTVLTGYMLTLSLPEIYDEVIGDPLQTFIDSCAADQRSGNDGEEIT